MVNIRRNIKIYCLILVLFIFGLNSTIVYSEGLKIFDDAGLFTEDEILELDNRVNSISDKYDMDIVIVTTDAADGKTSRDYSDDFFHDNGFGRGENLDGILFLIDLDNGETYLSTSGESIKYLTDFRIESILDSAYESGLGDGDYYGGVKGFLIATEDYLESGIPSNQYSEDESVKEENTLTPLEAIISILSGGALSSGFFFRTKSKYKMKNPIKPMTFRDNSIISLSASEDRLIDTVLTHRKIQASNTSDTGKSTTHTSSSGKTHGGGGRKL